MAVLQQIWLYEIIGSMLLRGQNTTTRVYGTWIKIYCALCSKTYNTLHSCHNFLAGSQQAARVARICETSLLSMFAYIYIFDIIIIGISYIYGIMYTLLLNLIWAKCILKCSLQNSEDLIASSICCLNDQTVYSTGCGDIYKHVSFQIKIQMTLLLLVCICMLHQW